MARTTFEALAAAVGLPEYYSQEIHNDLCRMSGRLEAWVDGIFDLPPDSRHAIITALRDGRENLDGLVPQWCAAPAHRAPLDSLYREIRLCPPEYLAVLVEVLVEREISWFPEEAYIQVQAHGGVPQLTIITNDVERNREASSGQRLSIVKPRQ